MPEKKSLSCGVSYELAAHATDDALTPGEISVLRLMLMGMRTNKSQLGSPSAKKR